MGNVRGRGAGPRTQEELLQLGVYGEVEVVAGAGRVMSVEYSEQTDLELPIANFGFGFSLASFSDAEVLTLSVGADPNAKMALPMLPRDVQRDWPVGAGGIQSPTTPDRFVEINEDETHLQDGVFVFGEERELVVTVAGGNVTMEVSGNLSLNVSGDVAINSSALTHNGVNVGATHRHGGVDTGIGNTGTPN